MSGVVSRRASSLHRNITVTPFLNKLYSMVDDSASDDLIRWSADGNSFVVVRHEDFAKEVLPRFFKHSNFSSFVRQLNMYGFHKVPHLQQGGLITDGPEAESWEFSNENFQRGQPDLLHFIRRKKVSGEPTARPRASRAAPVDMSKILKEIQVIRDHQLTISADIKRLQEENKSMWIQARSTEERYIKHQEMIDKILRFLATVFS
ncbi:hypothetical protein COEREDRAFT_40190, partial [Coemansia reversa NRRL 1564]